jgi:hypothetical protein
MATLAVTNSFSAGTTIVAADMNQNFDDVEAFVNTTPGVVQKDIVDAKGDIIAATAADAVSRLAVGTNTHVLTADSTEATGLKWVVSPPVDVVTTLGDLIVGTAADTVARLGAGTNTHVLTADSTTATGLSWVAPTTGDLTGLTAGTNIDISSASGPVPTITLAVDAALVTGSDGVGVDVTFHSDTAGDNMVWDSSEEKLTITGTNGQTALDVADGNVTIADDLTVTGNLTSHLNVATDSGAAIAPALGDENKYVLSTHATAVVTLPQNSAQAFAIGTNIFYERNGTGTLTFAAGAGATVTSKDSTLTVGDRYTSVAAIKIGTDAWSLIGNLG